MSFLQRTLPQRTLLPRQFTRSFSVAKATIIGRVGAQPETVTTSNGTEIVRYSVATSHGTPENRSTSWWKVSSLNERMKERTQGLTKGTLVYIEGEMQFRKLERDGTEEKILNITQQAMKVLQRKEGEGEVEGESQA